MANREKLTEHFLQEYNRLNPKQKQAVDQIEGPVMVIAGPGTGKTQILSARVGKILLSDAHVYPSNILCLTYTDNGAVNMRKRLQSFIGADAYSVNIFTFHAFCNTIIQENLSLFETRELDAISDLERIDLFRELIDTFPASHPLKRFRGDVYYEIQNLQSLFSIMKREGWSVAFINEKIDEYIDDLPNRTELFYATNRAGRWNKGDKKPLYQETIDKMERLRAAVGEFEHFQQMMREMKRYDFDDMINWVIASFENNSDLLARYQERYQYILVDEYQDTSGSQNRLIQLLISFWDKPNIFVVGDDDQSIFRFQGANVENMFAFSKGYENDLLTIVLDENYRSTQHILDVSKSLIERNDERLINKMEGLTKKLRSANKKFEEVEANLPSIKEYESQRHEMIDIATEIEGLVHSGIAPSKIAVLYKENKYGEELAKYFKQLDIPFYSKRDMNILEIPLAQKIILLLRYISTEHEAPYSGDSCLFEILHFDWFKIPAIDIAKMSVEVTQSQFTDNKLSLRQLTWDKVRKPAADLFTVVNDKLVKTASLLESFIADVPNYTLQALFERIVRKGGILNYIMNSDEKHWHLQVLTGLFDFVKEETRRNPLLTLKDLVRIIDLMIKERIILPLVRVVGSEAGVNLLTAHGAKGLEFEYVFFAGCNATFWEKKRKFDNGYKLPDTLFLSSASKETNDDEELRRLFYVALTRAEQHLIISYSRFNGAGKEMEPSRFIAELQESNELPTEKRDIDTDVLAEFQALAFEEEQRPEIEKMEREFVDALLDKFTLSVTALNNYLNCPLEFYFNSFIRIPSGKSESMEFGSAIHYALEQLFLKMKNHPEKDFPSKELFVSDFEWWMKRHRESFTEEQFNRRLQYGTEVLSNYYDKYVYNCNKIVTVEQRINNIVVNGVPIKGKLDKLEFDGKKVNVVDYKTGSVEYAKDKLQRPSAKNPNGGDYWRQATFYKILVDNFKKSWNVVSTEFDFIEPDKKKNYCREKIFISQEDIALVKEQITTVWDKIQNHDFYTGCGDKDCHWCNFVKTNDLAVALHDLQDEEIEVM